MFKKAFVLCGVILSVVFFCAPAHARSEFTIRVGLTTSPTHSANISYARFKELVEQKSNGRIAVEIFPDGQLGNDKESVEAVQMGTLTMTGISSAIVAQFEPNFSIFDLPFLFPDREIAYKMFEAPEIGGFLRESLKQRNIVCLAFWESGYRHLTNNVREISSLSDVRGLKIRTMGNEYHIAAWEAWGASPTPIAFTELYTALQQRTVDGMENPYGLIVSQKFYEVIRYLTETGHILTVMPVIMNKDFYDSLPSDLVRVIEEAVAETTPFAFEIARQEELEARRVLEGSGVVITELSAEEKEKFRAAASAVYDRMAQNLQSELVDKVRNFAIDR
jgi:tripartite ATP-independent transporter DctP family solute receptor